MRFDEQLRLTRRDVARRQIETAIDMLISGADSVCINLIAWASVDQLRGLLDHLGKPSFFGAVESEVRPDRLAEWYRLLKRHYNFTKHSDRDPIGVIEDFRPKAVVKSIRGGACWTPIDGSGALAAAD